MDYLRQLNDKQLEAVQSAEGYLRVIAGAGSGKTKLLVSRYAYLVKEYGIDSANILCVTFTNKAAGEMKRRIRALIGDTYDTSLICTYHGFCARVLREDVEKILFPKEFQIIDTAQQKSILGEIYRKFELKLDHGSFEKMVRRIQFYKSMNREYVNNVCCTDKRQIMTEIASFDDRIMEEYMQRQKQIYALDFSDLMYFTLDVFHRCPAVLEKWQDRLNYIQVDEFQDSSATEMELIDLLSAKHRNLMIVGDPDQNIYEWRGSDVKLLVDFDKTHIPTETVFLNQNYRSTPQILRCANSLIEKNVLRLKKDLFTNNCSGLAVYHYHMKNEYAEAAQITEIISELRRQLSCNFGDFAVLYRSGFLSRIVEKKFTEEGIPYEILGGVKFYHRMEIQDIMAYLRLVAFDDDISFKRIVNKPRRRFGRMKLQALQRMQQKSASLYSTLKENIDDPAFKNSGAKEFIEMIEKLRQEADSLYISELVARVCTDSGYEKYIRELGDMERFENLSEFKRIAAEYEAGLGESVSLKEFINHISLQSEDDGEKEADTVKFMTIHAAKGLEFPNVFVLGLSEGIFPSAKSIEERKQLGLEEERRLCYVAITRAENKLYLLDSEGFLQNGKMKLPSRFLKEMGENNYIRIGTISKELQEAAEKAAADGNGIPEEKVLKSVGDRVVHPAFGEGSIVGYEKNKNSYRIKFDKLASERIMSASFFDKERSLPVISKAEEKAVAPVPSDDDERKELPCQKQETPHTDIEPVTYDKTCGISEEPSELLQEGTFFPTLPQKEDEATIPCPPPAVQESGMSEELARAVELLRQNIIAPEDADIGAKKENVTAPDIPSGADMSEELARVIEALKKNIVEADNTPGDGISDEAKYKRMEERKLTERKAMPCPPDMPQKEGDEEKVTPPDLSGYDNLWNRDDVPKTGWSCAGITDLGAPVGVCQMCGHQIIRYVHHMVHPHLHQIDAGCICAGRMEGDVERAKQRENDFKKKEARRESFKKRRWKKSRNNNSFLVLKEHLIVLYYNQKYNNWKYSLDNVFCEEVFRTKEEAMDAAFEAYEGKVNNG